MFVWESFLMFHHQRKIDMFSFVFIIKHNRIITVSREFGNTPYTLHRWMGRSDYYAVIVAGFRPPVHFSYFRVGHTF